MANVFNLVWLFFRREDLTPFREEEVRSYREFNVGGGGGRRDSRDESDSGINLPQIHQHGRNNNHSQLAKTHLDYSVGTPERNVYDVVAEGADDQLEKDTSENGGCAV